MRSLRPLLLCAILLSITPAASPAQLELGPQKAWYVGAMVGTFAGPSHADLLFRTNDIMQVLGSTYGTRLTDFESSTPLGLRLQWNVLPEVGFSATYSYSDYASAQIFDPLGWSSPRELTTKLHEVGLALHYGLDFVRNQRLLPYVGFGVGIVMADSDLSIDLINVAGAPESDPENPYPDQSFTVSATDRSLAYFGLAGLVFRMTDRISWTAEIQGVMGDVRQDFDYDGSLQYLNPTDASNVDDPRRNDILMGSYPLDLNGVRLAVGLLFGL